MRQNRGLIKEAAKPVSYCESMRVTLGHERGTNERSIEEFCWQDALVLKSFFKEEKTYVALEHVESFKEQVKR